MKALAALITLTTFFWSSTALGGVLYVIYLKNGGEFKTSYYWEEEHEIKFYVFGGVMGISRQSVDKIQEWQKSSGVGLGDTSNDVIVEKGTVNERVNISVQGQVDRHENKKQESSGADIDIEYYQEKRAALREKLEDAMRRHDEASARKDMEAKGTTWKEMVKFNGAMTNLVEEVKEKYKGVLPEWWHQQISGKR